MVAMLESLKRAGVAASSKATAIVPTRDDSQQVGGARGRRSYNEKSGETVVERFTPGSLEVYGFSRSPERGLEQLILPLQLRRAISERIAVGLQPLKPALW